MSSSSTYACPYCELPRDQTTGFPLNTQAPLRTLGRQKELAEGYAKDPRSDKNVNKNKKYFNTVHPPLIKGPPDTYVLDILPLRGTIYQIHASFIYKSTTVLNMSTFAQIEVRL